jgi:hypothetical protein
MNSVSVFLIPPALPPKCTLLLILYLRPKVKYGVDLQSLFGHHVPSCIHGLRPRIWAHIRRRYWSAKIDDMSL